MFLNISKLKLIKNMFFVLSLCQSEMAKKTANMLCAVLVYDKNHMDMDHPTSADLASNLGRLPLPEDYALQELDSLLKNYMFENLGS